MDASLIDSDIVNEVLKQRNAKVVRRASVYLAQHGQFTLSVITRYEIARGLKELRATVQLARFDTFCHRSTLLPLIDDILDRASDLWAAARHSGQSAQDADLMIAATALAHNLTLVTGNTPHFAWIPGLKLDDWRN